MKPPSTIRPEGYASAEAGTSGLIWRLLSGGLERLVQLYRECRN